MVGVPNSVTARLGPLSADLCINSLAEIPLQDMRVGSGDSLYIRPESVKDHAAIQAVEQAAFSSPNESRLVNLARERGNTTLSLVAVQAGYVIGHILFTPLRMGPDHVLRGVGLGPIAAIPGGPAYWNWIPLDTGRCGTHFSHWSRFYRSAWQPGLLFPLRIQTRSFVWSNG